MKIKTLSTVINVAAQGVTSLKCIYKDLMIVGCGDGTLATFFIAGHKITPSGKK